MIMSGSLNLAGLHSKSPNKGNSAYLLSYTLSIPIEVYELCHLVFFGLCDSRDTASHVGGPKPSVGSGGGNARGAKGMVGSP